MPVTCLARVRPSVDVAGLCQAIVDAFAAADAVAIGVPRPHRGERHAASIDNAWTSDELSLAARLAIERYGHPDWNATGTSRKEEMRIH